MESISDKMSGMGISGKPNKLKLGSSPVAESDGAEGHSELHAHGDGTYHSVMDGEKTEHPSIGHAMAHMAMKHEPDGTHTHVLHGEDGGHTSHHAKDGEVSGPDEHEDLEALKAHMAQFLNEEGHEDGESESVFD